jgi:hypothetical protein
MKYYGDGKVDTSPRIGTSYYHLSYGTPFCMIYSTLFFEIFETWAISLFSLFSSLFLNSPVSFGDMWRGINPGTCLELYFVEWVNDTMLTSNVEA